ncbi:hypothetical protein NC653_025838 [Populus alba x Populus x berolinensis]|uniref:Uncharacterized protein n=1 Tax=Populus alba x Populus x berolinensis TaxID=444605 RepID=A0AAD6MDB7_9ROSI|nr:hypothetical protein NC653_025838 [Populus alba x Populus x berolinensis]
MMRLAKVFIEVERRHRSSSISNFGYRKSWHLEVVVASSRSTCYKTKVPPRRVNVKQAHHLVLTAPIESSYPFSRSSEVQVIPGNFHRRVIG